MKKEIINELETAIVILYIYKSIMHNARMYLFLSTAWNGSQSSASVELKVVSCHVGAGGHLLQRTRHMCLVLHTCTYMYYLLYSITTVQWGTYTS